MLMIGDASYMMHRVVHGGKSDKITNPSQKDWLVSKFLGSLRATITGYRPWGFILCLDEKSSWRHECDYYKRIPNRVKGVVNEKGYKGTRIKKDDGTDWDTINEAHESFTKIIQRNFEFTVHRCARAEADDVMAYVCSMANRAGLETLIFSSDGDANQLLNRKSYRINPNTHTLYLSYDMEKIVLAIQQELMSGILSKNRNKLYRNLRYILNKTDSYIHPKTKKYDKYPLILNIEYVVPWGYMLTKIIRGDSGDNIHPINCWKKKSPSGKVSIRKTAPKSIEGFIKSLILEYEAKENETGKPHKMSMKNLYDESFITRVVDFVFNEDKSGDFEKKSEEEIVSIKGDIRRGYLNNRNMVLINPKELPTDVMNSLKMIPFDNAQTRFKYSSKIENYKEHLNDEEEFDEETESEYLSQEDINDQMFFFS